MPAHPALVQALQRLPVLDGQVWWSATPNHVTVLVSQHLRSLGIKATAHQLRHYAGTTWYEASGHDLLTTARLLRHRAVQSTQGYAAIETTRPAAVVQAVPLPVAVLALQQGGVAGPRANQVAGGAASRSSRRLG